jgi:hypothetical protein
LPCSPDFDASGDGRARFRIEHQAPATDPDNANQPGRRRAVR